MQIWLLLLLLSITSPKENARNIEPAPEIEHAYVAYLPQIGEQPITTSVNTQIVYGYASPHRRQYPVPFYNWGAFAEDCQNPNYWPMVRGQSNVDIDDCNDGRMLLIYNEPELSHFSASPRQAANFVHLWSTRWNGSIACCGNFYGAVDGYRPGLQWFNDFIAEYAIRHGSAPPIDAIHLHVYEYQDGIIVDALQQWRAIADYYDWQIIVSESGTFPTENYLPADVAARLPVFLSIVETELRPSVLMWFSDYIQPWALGPPPTAAWHHFNLTTIDAELTEVGYSWQRWTKQLYKDSR